MNVTGTPATGLPAASVTSTCSGAPKTVKTKALCESPPLEAIDAGAPAMTWKTLLVADADPAALACELIRTHLRRCSDWRMSPGRSHPYSASSCPRTIASLSTAGLACTEDGYASGTNYSVFRRQPAIRRSRPARRPDLRDRIRRLLHECQLSGSGGIRDVGQCETSPVRERLARWRGPGTSLPRSWQSWRAISPRRLRRWLPSLPPANVTLGLLPGAVNVTDRPLTGISERIPHQEPADGPLYAMPAIAC